mgnify:CR=1 FL=1
MEGLNSNKIIERIRKLLSLAEGSSGHEAETAAAMARRLMREHAVSQATVEESDRPNDPLVRVRVSFDGLKLRRNSDILGYSRTRTAWWKRELASAVGRYLDLRSAYNRGTNVWWFYGYQSDVEVAIYLYDICARQINDACKAHVDSLKHSYMCWSPGRSRTAGTEFRQSAVGGLRSKFRELKRTEQNEDPTGFALMVNRKNAVNRWVESNFSFGSAGSGWGGNASHSRAGWNAGREIRLNAGVSGSTTSRGSIRAVKGYLK